MTRMINGKEYPDDLRSANLRNADLSNANLHNANLSGAYLSGANLSRANLSGADLSCADLSGAYLSRVNLSRADLSDTHLLRADLSRANLRNADLTGAELSGADLSCADLSGAHLSRANISGANLSDAGLPGFQLVPEKGAFIGWKKVHVYSATTDQRIGMAVLELKILGSRTSNLVGRKCRTNKARVIRAYTRPLTSTDTYKLCSIHDSCFEYVVGEIVTEPEYDSDIRVECTRGIHFFITKQEAEDY